MLNNAYEYKCPECETEIKKSIKLNLCVKCGIELCENCYKNHKKVCIWCYDKISDEYLWKLKIVNLLFIFLPIIVLLIPTPTPFIILMITSFNINTLLLLVIYVGVSLAFCFVLRIIYTKRMIKSIPVEKKFNINMIIQK